LLKSVKDDIQNHLWLKTLGCRRRGSRNSSMVGLACGYVTSEKYGEWYEKYDYIQGMLITIIKNPEKWTL